MKSLIAARVDPFLSFRTAALRRHSKPGAAVVQHPADRSIPHQPVLTKAESGLQRVLFSSVYPMSWHHANFRADDRMPS